MRNPTITDSGDYAWRYCAAGAIFCVGEGLRMSHSQLIPIIALLAAEAPLTAEDRDNVHNAHGTDCVIWEVAYYNDRDTTNHATVLAWFDATIAKLKADAAVGALIVDLNELLHPNPSPEVQQDGGGAEPALTLAPPPSPLTALLNHLVAVPVTTLTELEDEARARVRELEDA